MNYIFSKTALITGAADGIGRATALEFSKLGVNVILVGRNEAKLREIASECQEEFSKAISSVKHSAQLVQHGVKPEIFLLDVRDKARIFKEFSAFVKPRKIDILINNAGLALGLESFEKGDLQDWEVMIDTNVKGVLYITRALLEQMKRLPTAHIVNLGSVAGKIAYPNGNIYCVTKAAVRHLSEALNCDLFGSKVKVTTIAPGAVETEFSKTRFNGDLQRAKATYEGYTPLYAQDIAEAIISVVNTKPSVNIQYLDIMPTDQRNPYMVFRG